MDTKTTGVDGRREAETDRQRSFEMSSEMYLSSQDISVQKETRHLSLKLTLVKAQDWTDVDMNHLPVR